MSKKVLLAVGLIILAAIAIVCAVVLGGAKELTPDEAVSALLKRLDDEPILLRVNTEIGNPTEQKININDGQESHSEKVYTIGLFYDDNAPGLEGRLADKYAISLDGKKVYWYDPAKESFMDYDLKPTCYEAKAKLLELMADDPYIDKMDIWDEDINPNTDVIDIKDRQGMRTESVYNFSFRFNENMPGLEERLADDFAISLDCKHVYWYDTVNNWYIDYNDRSMYNPGTGEWADN